MTFRTLLLGGGAVVLLSGLAVISWQNKNLKEAVTRKDREIGEIAAANDAQKTALQALLEQNARNGEAIISANGEMEKLAARARYLEKKTREAMKHEPVLQMADPWPDAVRWNLCLRWLSAENRLPGDYVRHNPGTAAPGGNDSVAAFCAAWNRLTPEETVTWAGLLLDQLGRMKIKNNAAKAAMEKAITK